ncbi:MAG: AraC family transcriptional regulator [Burkholderiaceae bacterium]
MAAVVSGSFVYRVEAGRDLLAPGAILLGNVGRCFECGHEHSQGDRCLSFHFTPECWEGIARSVPGRHRGRFGAISIPPLPSVLPVMAALESSGELGQPIIEEVALAFAGQALRLSHDLPVETRMPRAIDERRISTALHQIEESSSDVESDDLSLASLARQAAMSRYHFLRTFRRIVGMTPHQYLLHVRMRKAALRIRATREPLTTIALNAGFNDLSTFSRRFRGVMGASPSEYRRASSRPSHR